ncbi:MAG: hypothetical protein OEY20_07985 [Gemmatimonadota bacterium]|nr:hypothetical protein [Gemmatimonadota bacterium]MDH4349670.1 hypothetical protein [Gemmatimonadota bacterium]MDH5197174.1 hypothetical protein [Gemmatimonadota bacterium]
MRWIVLIPALAFGLAACEPAAVSEPDIGTPGNAEATVTDEVVLSIDVRSTVVNLNTPSEQIPVAVWGSEVFDVYGIDVASATFGPNQIARLHDFTLESQTDHVRDINEDGFVDLLFHFDKLAAGFEVGVADACLSLVHNDIPLTGCETITVVAQGGGPPK